MLENNVSVHNFAMNILDVFLSQGFGFENKGTEALSFRQVYGCFLRLMTSQRIKGCLWK